MELNLLYVHGESIGYGRMGVNVARELEAMGVDVYDDLPIPEGLVELSSADRMVNEGRRSKKCRVVCWQSVPTHARGWYANQYPVISTMFETDFLPEAFRETLHAFELVVVPSDQNVELFSQYHPNVRKVPLGIDPAVWHFTPRQGFDVDPEHLTARERVAWSLGVSRRRIRQRRMPFFNFLIGGSGARKGTDLAYRAFVEVFGKDGSWGDGPVPRLIMKSPKGEERISHDRVSMISGRITAEQEVDLYASAHCYLQPSRGEGFGLQPLQAMAQGCPTILTDAHGHAAFAKLAEPIGSKMTDAAYFIYGRSGQWWEPNFDELCERMRWVYDHYDVACGRASAAAEVVRTEFTWRRTAEAFVDAVGEDRLSDPFPVAGEWTAPDPKLYPVITNKDHVFDIAGINYRFTAGQRYHEMADVKRILFEAGMLDPACIEDVADTGLLESQLERIGDYSARHSYCPACSQRLNTHPTRADDMFAERELAANN